MIIVEFLNSDCTRALVTKRGWFKTVAAYVYGSPYEQNWQFEITDTGTPMWIDRVVIRAFRRNQRRKAWFTVHPPPFAKLLRSENK